MKTPLKAMMFGLFLGSLPWLFAILAHLILSITFFEALMKIAFALILVSPLVGFVTGAVVSEKITRAKNVAPRQEN
jgi:hypothetical protein